jgi:hypothetical protein
VDQSTLMLRCGGWPPSADPRIHPRSGDWSGESVRLQRRNAPAGLAGSAPECCPLAATVVVALLKPRDRPTARSSKRCSD